MLLLTACPYESKVPVSEPTEKIDKKLLGVWIAEADLEYETPTQYEIDKFSKEKYSMIEKSYSTYDSSFSETKYFMHTSTIGANVFLNIQEFGGGVYYIHRIVMGDDEFTLFEVSENIDEQFTSPEELKTFISSNMHLSFFFTKDEQKYIRKSK